MAENQVEIQPGRILSEVITGGLKTAGTNLEKWCAEKGLHRSTVNNAIHGQSGGDRGKEILNLLFERIGHDRVLRDYQWRVESHAKEMAALSSTGQSGEAA